MIFASGRDRRRGLLVLAGGAVFLVILAVVVDLWPGSPLEKLSFSRSYTDRSGRLLRIFLTDDEKYRSYCRLADLPPALVRAVLLQEDRWFYAHPGVNPVTLVKAAYTTYIQRSRRIGASTITMQLARLLYRLDSRTLPGKLGQIVAALWLEARYSKQEILEAYLNLVPCGRNLEGYPAAAWYYFDKNLKELNLSELLLLCVIPQNPRKRAPSNGVAPPELTEARRVLFQAWTREYPEDADSAVEMDMRAALTCRFPFRAPHQTEYLETRLPDTPKAVRTTLNLDLQTGCETALARYLESVRSEGADNAAVLVADWTTMETLAAIGSADYFNAGLEGQVNGMASKRSPGSTLKPFIYALALDQGLIHSESLLKDTPTSFSEYTPDNFGKDFVGPIKAWRALVDSRNIPAVSLASLLRNPDLYDFLAAAGIAGLKPKDNYGLSIVLGSAETSLRELAELYSLLPNGGRPRRLVDVIGPSRVQPAAVDTKTTGLMTPAAAWITQRMLERNPAPEGTAGPADLPPVAYKTGTSIGFKDAWSIGICDRYIIAVWFGNFDGAGSPVFNGRSLATPLMFRLAAAVLAALPSEARLPPAFPPDTVKAVAVCSVSGALPGPICARTEEAWYIPGVSPIKTCSIHREIRIDRLTGYRTDESAGDGVETVVREFWPSDLAALFAAAGLPRLTPPPYPPELSGNAARAQGSPPVIVSPLYSAVYILRRGESDRRGIALSASGDADSPNLFWFADDAFIGKTAANQKLFWQPTAGRFLVTVLDEHGRADSTPVIVEERD